MVGHRMPCIGNRGLWLGSIGWHGIVVAVGEIWVISPKGIYVFEKGWALAIVLHCIGMLNAWESGLTLNSNMTLNATSITKGPNLKHRT